MDRLTVAGSSAFQIAKGIDYLENHCVEEPVKLCEFKKITGRILKTVDSVYQDVATAEECRDHCLNSPFRCHSYDYGDTGDMVCRLSHHSRATLSDIQVRGRSNSYILISLLWKRTTDGRRISKLLKDRSVKWRYGEKGPVGIFPINEITFSPRRERAG